MNFWKQHGAKIAILAAMLGLALGVNFYIREYQLRIHMQEEIKAKQEIIASKDDRLKSITQAMEEREKKTSALVKQIDDLKKRPIPVREIVKEIPKYIPITEPVPLPEPQEGLVLDAEQAQGLRVYYLDCEAKTMRLEACMENEADWKRKELTWQEKEKLLEQQRDAAIRAYKGGTFWQRVVRGAKTFGIGFALGAAAGAAAK